MIAIIATVTLVLCALTLRDELRGNGTLNPRRRDHVDDIFELPVPDGWTAMDVLQTVAEIEAICGGTASVDELREAA